MAVDFQMKVSTEVLRAQSKKVQEYVTAMQKDFDGMRKVINGSTKYWIGDASDQHRAMLEKNEESISEILKRLKEHPIDLEKMAGVYEATEELNEQLASELPADVI